jgi:hypothetical protein
MNEPKDTTEDTSKAKELLESYADSFRAVLNGFNQRLTHIENSLKEVVK